MLGIGLIGFGYWGPNLARNFASLPGAELKAICDADGARREQARRNFPQALVTGRAEDITDSPDIDAVLICTPVSTHYPLGKLALTAGKHVLIEKPLTQDSIEAEELLALARAKNLVLAVDHTFLFTGAVQKIKELVDSGELGRLYYLDSVRVNLGLFQPDVNVLYDLAPHDLSIACHLLNQDPIWVRAMGASHACVSQENLVYLHLEFPNGVVAHFHLSWLAPVKIRRTLIGGDRKMVVYDDLEATEKVKIYDKGIVTTPSQEALHKIQVDYRTGDMVAPKLLHLEALKVEAEHFVDCVENGTRPLAAGEDGLRVVKILEAAQKSLPEPGGKGAIVMAGPDAPYLKIAPDVKMGKNVRLGGFVNLYGCTIGDDCMLGTFVEIQKDVVIGERVKVQSHTFVCSGVTIEDEAFIGHGVMFINDKWPRSTTKDGQTKTDDDWKCLPTKVGRRAAIGSNATILGGVSIGEEALVGAGSLVASDVPPKAVVAGNPARVLRYLTEEEV